jgi:phosphohistidine swiveling domain-containing protein
MTPLTARAAGTEVDPLMPSWRATHHWTTTNLGEAAPGVLTPLGMALWGAPAERAARQAAYTLGVLNAAERAAPDDPADWILRPFHGRLAMKLEFMAELGDRVPGITGVEAIRGMFGEAPPGMTFHPTRERYPAIAWRFPLAFARFPATLKRVAEEQDRWWRHAVRRLPLAGRAEALAAFAEAVTRFERTSSMQLVGTLCSVQPLYDAVEKLIAQTGVGDIGVLSGSGGAEMAVIADIWRASRGELTLEHVVARHGFHGPGEGELSSVVWREDATPLGRLIAPYAELPEADSPIAAEARRATEMAEQQAAMLAALPAIRRPAAQLVLGLAARRIPLRGVAKRSFLQAIDVARAAARRVGGVLAESGALAEAGDVFLLTAEELQADPRPGLTAIAERRRATRAGYQQLKLTTTEWYGLPETEPLADAAEPEAGAAETRADTAETGADTAETGVEATAISGAGVSSGVVEGFARVLIDPSFADVEPDEVLVAPTTDPSWSSVMFISAALVVDMGGALSHAAVVARELRIPCVVNTRDGTRRLRTGDWVRVDGSAGTVEILARGPDRCNRPPTG